MQENQEIQTYGDLKKLVDKIKNKQLKDKVVSQGKSIALDQLLGLIPGAQNVKTIVDLVSAISKKPDTKKTDTWLDKLDVDDQVSAIVDDTVEAGYFQDLIKSISGKSDEENLPDNFSATSDLQKYISDKYKQRTVSTPETMTEGKEILKQLLLVELEDMKTFDDDPMGFILRKYKSLNDTLIELMTRSYKEYLYGVYIVAPKPTTFKVVLHNKQYFYLVYLGPTYEASVAGKNYYLSDLGEKERCIVAISKMLRGGPPINTKGPEGAEKGSKDQEGSGGGGGGNFGGGGDQSGGGEEGEPELTASAAAEAEGGEEPEQLTENAKLTLKLLLEQALEQPESNVSVKKKSTIPKTPILQRGSLTPQSLLTANKVYGKNNLVKEIIDAINSKISGEDEEQVKTMKSFLISLVNDVANVQSTYTDVSELADDSVSINFSKDTINALSGVNRTDLNRIGVEFGEVLGAIYVSRRIQRIGRRIVFPSGANNPLTDFFIDKINVSSKYKKGAASSLRDVIEENKKNIANVDEEREKELYDVIENSYDYDASVSYLYMAQAISDEEINSALSLLAKGSGDDTQDKNKTLSGLGIDLRSISSGDSKKIKEYINKKIAYLRDKYGDKEVERNLNEFYAKMKRKLINEKTGVRWEELKGNFYGLITSPIAYYLASRMNEIYKEELKSLVQRTEIKQLRLSFSLKQKAAMFTMQSFKSPKASFIFLPGKISANEPEKGFMAFRME